MQDKKLVELVWPERGAGRLAREGRGGRGGGGWGGSGANPPLPGPYSVRLDPSAHLLGCGRRKRLRLGAAPLPARASPLEVGDAEAGESPLDGAPASL